MPPHLDNDSNEATRTRTHERPERKAAARLMNRTAHVLASVGRDKGDAGKAMLQTAVLDLSSSGCDAADISRKLAIPEQHVRELLADGLDALSRRQTQTAEIVRAQADAKLSRIEARLNELVESADIDVTSLIRALEVQARITGQRVDLYAAKVKQSESDLADLAADVLAIAGRKSADLTAHPDGPVTLTVEAEKCAPE